ncbi:conserved protein of unknown function [Ruminococcaceae bacterium BL-6]|nr:conserved protein of unknown function [Ruminococcaceae bacterium BL-6]
MSFTVSVTLTDDEYAKVEEKAKDKGLTIAQYVKRYPIGGDDFDSRYAYLKTKAVNKRPGEPFTVMSIFSDWEDIDRGTKLSLGRNFYHLVKRGELPPVKPDGKSSSNVQLYIIEK